MFDEQDYYSDEQQTVFQSHKAIESSKVLMPSTNSDFNHLTGDSQSLLKMMKERGIDLSDNQVKKMRVKQATSEKPAKDSKGRVPFLLIKQSGFFDGGASATLQQLIKALNKSLSKADPQQANCVLSYILEKKKLSIEDINKFGIMKCKILFGYFAYDYVFRLGSYKDCEQKAQYLICKASTDLNAAIFSNYLAKCKAQNNKVLQGYIDFLRAKSLITQVKQMEVSTQQQRLKQQALAIIGNQSKIENSTTASAKTHEQEVKATQADVQRKKLQSNFKGYEVDSVLRQIDYTEMEYNIKLGAFKNNMNVLYPTFQQFKHRKIKQVVCGDYHTLFLTEGTFDGTESTLDENWKTEVFGLGENGVGQVLGKPGSIIFKEPVLITSLSGKGINGIYANKQTSLAYNAKGQIFQWGVKENRNGQITVNFNVNEQISMLEKGNKHYALLTKSNKFYTWGEIQYKGSVIYKQLSPQVQQQNIVNFSCGNSCIMCVDKYGDAFALGSNERGQLCLTGQKFSKSFKKIANQNIIGKMKRIYCISDCTFYVNEDEQVYFTEQPQENIRQAQFGGQVKSLISISGHTGTYYATNQVGQIYQWNVDQNVKFRLYRENEQVSQRYNVSNRGTLFRVKSVVQPEYCSARQVTKDVASYEQIRFEIELRDKFGLYGNKEFLISPRCQIFLSTYELTQQQLIRENKQFLERYKLSTSENRIVLSEIVDPRLHSYKISRNQESPWIHNLDIVVDTAGKYYFYVILEETVLHAQQLCVELSSKQSEMSEQTKFDKKAREQEKRRRAEQQKKRLLEEKLRKQQEQENRRQQTQKRAEQALKKHMKQQEDTKAKQLEERKARKQLQTGGGFDLNKLAIKKRGDSASSKSRSSKPQVRPAQMQRTTESFMRSTQSFLPDINLRPSSKRKLNLRKDSIQSAKTIKPLQKTAGYTNDSKGFLQSKTKDMGRTLGQSSKKKEIGKNMGQITTPKSKELLIKPTTLVNNGGVKTTLIKRGLSRTKK